MTDLTDNKQILWQKICHLKYNFDTEDIGWEKNNHGDSIFHVSIILPSISPSWNLWKPSKLTRMSIVAYHIEQYFWGLARKKNKLTAVLMKLTYFYGWLGKQYNLNPFSRRGMAIE